MPQKRNPVVLEHLRARVGWVLGSAGTAQTLVHFAAFGDTVDVEDEFYEPLFRTFEHGVDFLRLADAALASCQFDREKLAARATEGFTTATEIADTLVRARRALVSAGPPGRVHHGAALGGEPGAVTPESRRRGRPARRSGRPRSTSRRSSFGRRSIRGRLFAPARSPAARPGDGARPRRPDARDAGRDAAWRERREAQIADARIERHARAAELSATT